MGFIVNVQPESRGPGLARCGTEERAPVYYAPADPRPEPPRATTREHVSGLRELCRAIGA